MLQFLAQTDTEYSILEQAQMAIEGGCAWVHLRVPDLDDSMVRELAAELIPLCRESSTILTIDNRYELAKELAIHGVLITSDSGISAPAVRDILGPEAIIGVECASASSVVALQGLDLDYVVLPSAMQIGDIAATISTVVDAGIAMPFVATGDITLDCLPTLKAAGVNGILVGRPILDAADPVRATEEYLNVLTSDSSEQH